MNDSEKIQEAEKLFWQSIDIYLELFKKKHCLGNKDVSRVETNTIKFYIHRWNETLMLDTIIFDVIGVDIFNDDYKRERFVPDRYMLMSWMEDSSWNNKRYEDYLEHIIGNEHTKHRLYR